MSGVETYGTEDRHPLTPESPAGVGAGGRVFYGGSRQCSPLIDRLAPARDAGFTAVSVWPGDVRGMDRSDVRQAITDAGLFVSEVELITNWMPEHANGQSEFGQFLSSMTSARVLPLAAELGARVVSTAELFGLPFDLDRIAGHFGALCDEAAEYDLRIALEFVPTGGVPGLREAMQVIDAAGRDNGGLMIDAWHFFRSHSSLSDLAAVPGDRIFSIQLSDACATPEPDLNAGMLNRLMPGKGELDLAGLMRAAARTGTDAFIGIEVFSKALDSLPTSAAAKQCAQALDHCLSLAAEPRTHSH